MAKFDFNQFDDEEEDDEYSEVFARWEEERKIGLPHTYYDPDDLCDIIDTYLSFDDIEAGQDAVWHAFKIHPDNEDMIHDIMEMLDENELWNDLLEATTKFRHLTRVWCDGYRISALLHLGMEEDAFSCFKQAKKKFAKNKQKLALIYQSMAESLYDMDLYDAAINVIDEVLPMLEEKNCGELVWVQLQCYLANNDKDQVKKLADRMVDINPMDPDTWSRLGLIYKEIGEKEKSIEAFEFAHSLGKRESIDILNLIYSYKENGNFLKALEKSDEYLELSPDDYIINLLAVNICIELEEWEKALKYIEPAIQMDPGSNFLYLYKSKCLTRMGEIKKAIRILEEGLAKTIDTSNELKKELETLRREHPEY